MALCWKAEILPLDNWSRKWTDWKGIGQLTGFPRSLKDQRDQAGTRKPAQVNQGQSPHEEQDSSRATWPLCHCTLSVTACTCAVSGHHQPCCPAEPDITAFAATPGKNSLPSLLLCVINTWLKTLNRCAWHSELGHLLEPSLPGELGKQLSREGSRLCLPALLQRQGSDSGQPINIKCPVQGHLWGSPSPDNQYFHHHKDGFSYHLGLHSYNHSSLSKLEYPCFATEKCVLYSKFLFLGISEMCSICPWMTCLIEPLKPGCFSWPHSPKNRALLNSPITWSELSHCSKPVCWFIFLVGRCSIYWSNYF